MLQSSLRTTYTFSSRCETTILTINAQDSEKYMTQMFLNLKDVL